MGGIDTALDDPCSAIVVHDHTRNSSALEWTEAEKKTDTHSPSNPFLSEASYLLRFWSDKASRRSQQHHNQGQVPHMAGRRQRTVEGESKSQNLLWECLAPCMTAKGPGQGPVPYKSQFWKMEMLLKIKLNCTHKCLALGPWKWEREGDDLYSPGPALF